MSRYALIIGLPHAADAAPVVLHPPAPPMETRARFKADFMAPRSHPDYQRVELVDSRRGITKRKSFLTPAEAKAREKAAAVAPAGPAAKPAKPKPPPESPDPI